MAKTEGRMRLTIVGGFLGSGKTTWLRHQLHEDRFHDAYVIVNEAAEMPVDDALLGRSSRLSVLAGGCACCVGRPALISLLRELCDARSKSDHGRVDEIILETSGLADPAPIVEAIRTDPMLVHHIVVGEIIVAVDGLYGFSQLRREKLGRKQTELADQLVITKIDEASDRELKVLLAALKQLNPGATLSGSNKGTPADLPDFSDAVAEPLPNLEGEAERATIFPTVLDIDRGIDWTALTVWLSALLHARGDDVLRVKGVIRTPAGRLLLQSVRKVMQSPEILPEQLDGLREDNKLVVIGSGYAANDLRNSLRHFASVRKN
jgi:G3E family GTPase